LPLSFTAKSFRNYKKEYKYVDVSIDENGPKEEINFYSDVLTRRLDNDWILSPYREVLAYNSMQWTSQEEGVLNTSKHLYALTEESHF
jgi:hypothetical protein